MKVRKANQRISLTLDLSDLNPKFRLDENEVLDLLIPTEEFLLAIWSPEFEFYIKDKYGFQGEILLDNLENKLQDGLAFLFLSNRVRKT